MMVVCLVTIWLSNAVLVATYGVMAAANTRDRLDARIAAVERASALAPEGTGGSVWPATPVDGFHELLVTNPQTGRLDVLDGDHAPAAGAVILRQWRLTPNADGGRVFEVSTAIVDAVTRRAVPEPRGGSFTYSRIVE